MDNNTAATKINHESSSLNGYYKLLANFILERHSEEEQIIILKTTFTDEFIIKTQAITELMLMVVENFANSHKLLPYLEVMKDEKSKILLIYLSIIRHNPGFLSQRKNSTFADKLLKEKEFNSKLIKKFKDSNLTFLSSSLN